MKLLLPLLLLTAFTVPVFADSAIAYVVHGIPGTALGAPTTDLPVDIQVNNSCVAALSGLNFGEIRGPLTLPAPASYTIEIKPANALNPCSEPTLLTANASLNPGNNVSIVAHLTAAGTPLISAFANDVSRTASGQGRVILHHAAEAPTVDVNVFRGEGRGNTPGVAVPGFTNGAQAAAQIRPGDWRATLSAGGTVVFGPAGPLELKPNQVLLVYAVGTFPASFQLIVKPIPANQ